MENPKTLVAFGTQDTGRRKTKQEQKTTRMSNTERTKTGGDSF